MAGKPSLQFYPGDWFKSEDVRQCSPTTRGIWFDLILYAFNRQSYGEMKGTVDGLARLCGATTDEMEKAVMELDVTGTAEVVKESNGLVRIVCRRLRDEQVERDGNAEYMRDYRAKKGSGKPDDDNTEDERKSDVSDLKDSSTSRSRTEDEVEDEEEVEKEKKRTWTKRDVEAIYQLYPKKVGKKSAMKAIPKALKDIADRDGVEDPVKWLSDRVKAFADSPKGRSGQYCPYPATWFNDWRYDDDPSVWDEAGDDSRIGLMTYAEARDDWERRGKPGGKFPGDRYEAVPQDGKDKPLWRRAA